MIGLKAHIQEEIKTAFVELWDVVVMCPYCHTEVIQSWQLRGRRKIYNYLL